MKIFGNVTRKVSLSLALPHLQCLIKGYYNDKEINLLIGAKLKSQMDDREDVLRTSKLEKVMKMVISLNKLNNSDNLEDGKPSNTLFTYYVTSPEYSTCFEPVTPQYEKL